MGTMRKISSGLFAYLFALLVLCGAALPVAAQEPEGAAPAGPHIEVEAAEIDLGVVDKGAPAEAKFTLRNSGDQMLQIIRVKPG